MEYPFGVFVGYINNENNSDIPHYLVINLLHNVIEGSTAKLIDARVLAFVLAKEVKEQDELIAKKEALTREHEYSRQYSIQ